mgnify:CR=1 FL=1
MLRKAEVGAAEAKAKRLATSRKTDVLTLMAMFLFGFIMALAFVDVNRTTHSSVTIAFTSGHTSSSRRLPAGSATGAGNSSQKNLTPQGPEHTGRLWQWRIGPCDAHLPSAR